ncbi:acyl-homoserine-lactone synthase [Novosphingobium sp.]|uniref:acyl-homoserine-lactone synthase n=1 Tax=Novosphingobium sp. TaxID=1874826 RepID=UPI0038BD0E01
MLNIISPGTEPDAAVMRAMFAARKSVFVDLLGWDVPVLAGQYEVDQFDNVHARYLVLTDDEGAHLASARLLPTTRECILSGLFPMLCYGPPPAAPDIFEITRFCLDRRLRAIERRLVRDALVVALADYALANAISGYCAVAETSWLRQIQTFGWQCERLGAVVDVDGEHLAAVRIVIEPNTPALLAAAGIRATGLPSVSGKLAA